MFDLSISKIISMRSKHTTNSLNCRGHQTALVLPAALFKYERPQALHHNSPMCYSRVDILKSPLSLSDKPHTSIVTQPTLTSIITRKCCLIVDSLNPLISCSAGLPPYKTQQFPWCPGSGGHCYLFPPYRTDCFICIAAGSILNVA